MFFKSTDKKRKYSEFLDYLFKFYLTFDHLFGLMNQDHYTAIPYDDQDTTNNILQYEWTYQ